MAKVICAFTGLGKTYLSKNYNNIIDHDITKYKQNYNLKQRENFEALKTLENRTKNNDFPKNWLTDLKKLLFTENIILFPADEEIRELLIKEKIDFTFIIPDLNSKDILINRYKNRGNNEIFISRAISQLQI